MYALERFVYRRARAHHRHRAAHARASDRERRAAGARCVVIPNFVDLDDLSPRPKDNAFSREFGVHDKFVISYAGNLGPAQGLECFVDAAALLARSSRRLRSCSIGDGMLAESAAAPRGRARAVEPRLVIRISRTRGARHLRRVRRVCRRAGDRDRIGRHSVEGVSHHGVRAADRGATDAQSDLAQLVAAAGAGVVVPPESADALAAAVRSALADRQSGARAGRQDADMSPSTTAAPL